MKAISGKEQLWKVYAFYFAIPGLLLYFVKLAMPITPYSIISVSVALILWCVFICVALWRCAFNTKYKGLGYLARITTLPLLVVLLTSFLGLIVTMQALSIHGVPAAG